MTTIFDHADFNERLFFPRRDTSPTPSGAVDRMIDVAGGANLHLRVYGTSLPASSRRTVLFFHGNGEVVADYDDFVPMFERAGARLAVVDYRGYGRSTGTPSLRAAIDDAAIVLDAIREDAMASTDRQLFVMGRSLGAAAAIELYARAPETVAGFILESGATDVAALVRRRGMAVPASFDDETRAKFDPLVKLPRGRHPLLVMHGDRDELIAPSEAKQAYELSGTPLEKKKLVLLEGYGHNNVSFSTVYWSELATFLSSV